MNTEINIRENTYTHGYCCDFYVNGKKFYADVSDVSDVEYGGPECMIFRYINDDEIDWSGVYANRDVSVSKESLLECIKEFTEQESGA